MPRAKVAISLPSDQLVRIREVRVGRADSASGYITGILTESEKSDSLRLLIQDLVDQHGEPSSKDITWAEWALIPIPK